MTYAAANINCTTFPRSAVPASYVALINWYNGSTPTNNSHVELANQSNYNITFACTSDLVTLNNTCTDNNITLFYLYNQTNSHVAYDPYTYPWPVCLSTTSNLANFSKRNVTAGTVPDGNETCLVSLVQLNNSHVATCSNGNIDILVKIDEINYPPTAPLLVFPNNGNDTLFDRTPTFDWNESTDPNNDTLNYTIHIYHPVCPDITANVNTLTNYTPSQYLCTSYNSSLPYLWNVTVTDGRGGYNYSETWNFTIQSYIIINLTVNNVNFGSIARNETNDTVDDAPPPLLLQNDGNIPVNITGNATNGLWSTESLGTSYFQWKIDNSTAEPGSYINTNTQTTYLNVSAVETFLINNLHFDDTKDEAEIDLKITPPLDEPPGAKNSTLVFIAGPG